MWLEQPELLIVVVDNGKEILSMNEVLSYMLQSSRMLCEEVELSNLLKLDESEWVNYVNEVRGMIVTYPGMVRNVNWLPHAVLHNPADK